MGWTFVDALGLFGNSSDGEGGTLVAGCTYDFACNFNPEAVVDDGSCEITSCAGCTFPEASNYDPEALYDDGSCIELGGCNCPGDLDGNGLISVQDMLLFLGLFGEACPG
jgi:hypothetical protein